MKHKEYAILTGKSKDGKHSVKITLETVDTMGKGNWYKQNFRVVSAICDALEANYKGSYKIVKTVRKPQRKKP